jgi:ribosomal protein S18 acetylase RimI-like enzyme
MRAQIATATDVPSWLEIVREVEPLFGPMPDFEATLLRKIEERCALCIRSSDADASSPVLGGMLLGGTREQGWIRWLAVRSSARRRGVGQGLVQEAIRLLRAAKTISLDTFREENAAGWPARRLYARFGFVAGGLVEREGALRQRFNLTR